jgi:hypothetical protein
MLIHKILIRFKGKASKIYYLAHINNLIVKAILKSLSLSTYKDTCALLDRVKKNSWDKITMLLAFKDIAILRIIVL